MGNRDFHLVVDSVLSRAVVNEFVHKCDVVYHLAAAVGVRLIVEQPVHTLVTNLEGTEVVLEHCNRFGKRVLIASTSEVYGDHRDEKPLEETARRVYGPTTQRRWAYADSKAMDEFLALAHHQEGNLDCIIARLFNTVGPRQSGQYGMVVPRFVERALAGEPLDGVRRRQAREVLLPRLGHDPRPARADRKRLGRRDLQRGLDGADRDHRPRPEGDRRHGILVDDHIVPFEDAYGHGIEDMLHRIPSTDKIRAATGWQPTRDLDGILADVIAAPRTTASRV